MMNMKISGLSAQRNDIYLTVRNKWLKEHAHKMYGTLTVAATGCDIITAVVEIVALHITVAARLNFAVASNTASGITGCHTACDLKSTSLCWCWMMISLGCGCLRWCMVGLVKQVLHLFGHFTLASRSCVGCGCLRWCMVKQVLHFFSQFVYFTLGCWWE